MTSNKVPVTITYQKPGTQPPVFVAGTFSEPAWQPHEMEHATDEAGEQVFKKEVYAEPGSKVTYKFRLGTGDWWTLKDGEPTVLDSSGNKNHELEVPSLKEQPVANAAKELLARSDPHSGASTPAFARTAAEVADSAALLNKEEPEAQIPDDEAGRIGFRRLTATPIGEVANTAAEVADSAENLDNEVIVEIKDHPCFNNNAHVEIYDPEGDIVNDQEDFPAPPLFSHEAVGLYDGLGLPNADETDEQHDSRSTDDGADLDSADVNDPTLEPFPSNRDEIINTVRKLETGLNEDLSDFEGVPPSPVVNSSLPWNSDVLGSNILDSPIGVSPVIPRPSRRLDIPRSPRGSISSAHSSALSLQCISEVEETEETEEKERPTAVLLSPPGSRANLRGLKHSEDEEDEGISMKTKKPSGLSKKKETEQTGAGDAFKETESLLSSAVTGMPSPVAPQDSGIDLKEQSKGNDEIQDASDLEEAPQTPTIVTPDQGQNPSPEIVIKGPEDNEAAEDSNGRSPQAVAGASSGPTGTTPTLNEVHSDSEAQVPATGMSTSTEADTNSTSQVRKRNTTHQDDSDTNDQPGATVSTSPTGVKKAPGGDGWFKAFFRVLFFDWIGGLISRLRRSRRETLLTAGTAAILVGVGWWNGLGRFGEYYVGNTV